MLLLTVISIKRHIKTTTARLILDCHATLAESNDAFAAIMVKNEFATLHNTNPFNLPSVDLPRI